MAKRNFYDEISSKKSRSGPWNQASFYNRFQSIDFLIKKFQNGEELGDEEILRSIPVASIGVVESHFRGVYAVIIDSSEKYARNALKFKEDLKIEGEYFLAIQRKRISLGELVGHVFRLNSLEDIDGTISSIMEIGFLKELRSYEFEDHVTKVSFLSNAQPEKCIESVERMFKLRHILAHEYALNVVLDKNEILQDYENLKDFLAVSMEMLEKQLGYFYGYTMIDMHEYYREKYKVVEQKLEETIAFVKVNFERYQPDFVDMGLFEKAIEKWKEFRDAYANAFSSPFEGGSAEQVVRVPVLEQMTKYFIENLEEEYKLLR